MSETPNISPLQESVNKIAANAQDIAAQPISSLQLTTAQTVIAGVAAGGAVAGGTGTLTGAISTAAHNKEMQRQGRVKLEIDKLKLDLDIRAESSRESANGSVVAEDGEEMHGRKNKGNQQHHRDSDDNAKLSSAPQRDGDQSTRGDLGRESSLGRPSSATPSGRSFQKRAPIPKASSSTIFKKSRPERATHLEKVRRNIANFKQSLKTRTHDDALDQKLSGTLSTLRHELDHGQPSNMAALVAHTEPAQVAEIVREDDAVGDGSASEEEDDAASDEEDYDSGGGADDLAMRVILPSATTKDQQCTENETGDELDRLPDTDSGEVVVAKDEMLAPAPCKADDDSLEDASLSIKANAMDRTLNPAAFNSTPTSEHDSQGASSTNQSEP